MGASDGALGGSVPVQRTPNTSTSSTRTTTGRALLTPDSDSDSDFGEPRDDVAFSDLHGGGEAYELQDRTGQSSKAHRYHGHDSDHEYGHGLDDVVEHGAYSRRLSSSTVASFQLYTPDEENAVVRKFDRKLVLFLSVCYMLSFLDRSNIGNARLAGMEQDLQTRPAKDAISYPALIFLRVLLGIGEAGFSGVPFYLSFFFKRDELAFRTALFISAAPLATTFASSLAWLILKVGEASPIAPWRLLFLLEGFPSVVVGVVAWTVIPDNPQAASYLTDREKKVARLRLRHEKPGSRKPVGTRSKRAGLKSNELLSVLADPKAWITASMFFLANMAYSSLPVFLPTILHEMGHSALQSQALSAPPYFIAFITVLITAHLSDKTQTRAPFIIAHALSSALGYTVLALARPLNISSMLRYLAVYPAASGFFNVVVLIIAWTINNQPTESKQGGGFALMQVIGQCGPLVGTRLYPKSDEPFFERGMWTCAAAMSGVVLLAGVLWIYLSRQNRRIDTGLPGREEAQGLVASKEEDGTGGRPEEFKFMLASPLSASSGGSRGSAYASGPGVNADQLDKELRGLKVHDPSSTPGQRIFEYENALTPSTPRQALGFKVIKRANPLSDGPQLAEFPNEILTHILSHLHPDSHTAVALVSKRFHSLVTTSHAWRMAFQRFFPGQDALLLSSTGRGLPDDDELIRSEIRQFARLTGNASWRSEYLLRTRLLRSLARGKPSSSRGIGSSTRNSQTGKKLSAVLTYNSKLPSMVTNVHATFASSAKKPPRVIHGAADLNVCSASDPTNGKVEKWGLDDPFTFAQFDEVVPQILPYGVGEGPASVPNVMDVSQPFGVVGGEGFPGGRVFYRPTGVYRGKYLSPDSSMVDAHPDIPKIPELSEGICSVWIAKSSTVPSLSQTMVGILTGSTLGVVTAYALGTDPAGPRFASGQITARWVLSPGVPIIAIQVDENYSPKRKASGRVFAVALNALGEVFYLTQPPAPLAVRSKAEDATRCAWYAGRSTYWQLIESTRRQARPDESGKNAVRGAYSPRSPSSAMNLKKDQIIAEAREIERFLRYKPSHFRKVCDGWDMRRRLEVDFAAVGEDGAGENILVIDCGLDEEQTAAITRFSRIVSRGGDLFESVGTEPVNPVENAPVSSLFGGGAIETAPSSTSAPASPKPKSAIGTRSPLYIGVSKPDDWRETKFLLPQGSAKLTASSLDVSLYAGMACFEETSGDEVGTQAVPATPTRHAPSDVPGRRARMIGVGTSLGAIWLWNMREGHLTDGIKAVRIIQTESPEITSIAMSALYLVHGGSDGLVQAWDPLASTLDPIRTLNARSTGRVPRIMMSVNPALRNSNFAAVGAIYLDPDPTVLRGIVCFGTFVRYWAYSSTGQPSGRRRRLRHSDIHGRTDSSRRFGGGVKGYIAAEAEELRVEQHHKIREQARLRSRFGVGLADLTEEEALQYAEMISQEAFLFDEHRRTSVSETGSAFDTTSTSGRSLDTVTPDPSVTGFSPPAASSSAPLQATDDESDYELQIQQALRLSLLEGVNEMGQSPRGNSSGDYEFPITIKEKRGKRTPSTPSSSHTPMVQHAGSSSATAASPDMDDDLRLALELSLAEEESRKSLQRSPSVDDVEFPALGGIGKGKGRAW
ncbi:putative F-box domain-containing protein [Seiridium cardinale]